MSDTKIKELRSDIDELNELLKQAKRKKVQDLLSLEIRKLETEWLTLKESVTDIPKEVTPGPTTSAPVQKKYEIKLNGYGWDQSDKYVKIFVTLKNVHTLPKEQVLLELTDRSMELHVAGLDNKNYVLGINKLLEPINIEESHWKQKTDMVVIFLAKVHVKVKWSHVTEIEKKFEDQRNSRFKTDESDKKDPEESVMDMMRKMYESGDDDMKRMITKAMYESQHKKKTDIVDISKTL